MLRNTHGVSSLDASIPSSLARRLLSVRELCSDLSDSEFFIAVLVQGLISVSESLNLSDKP